MDKIKEIKRRRTPEAFLIDLIDGMTIDKPSAIDGHVFWEKDGVVLFERNSTNNILWVDDIIWSVFSNKFGLKYNDIQKIIKRVVKEYIGVEGLQPESLF